MNPFILVILSLVQEAIKIAPGLQDDLREIFSKPNPTPEDWRAAKAKRLSTPFEELAPDAKTIPDEPQAPV